MTYLDERKAGQRRVGHVLELKAASVCSLEYTVAPCTATDAGDGARCYRSRATCQDVPNYAATDQSINFHSSWLTELPPGLQGSFPFSLPLLDDKALSHSDQKVDFTGAFARQERMAFAMEGIGGDSNVPVFTPWATGLLNTGRAGWYWQRFLAIYPNHADWAVTLYRVTLPLGADATDANPIWRGFIDSIMPKAGQRAVIACRDVFSDFDKKAPAKVAKTNTVQTTASRTAEEIIVRDASQYPDPLTTARQAIPATVTTLQGTTELVEIRKRETGPNRLTLTRGMYGSTPGPLGGDDRLGPGTGALVTPIVHYSTADGLNGWHAADITADLLDVAGLGAYILASSFTDAKRDMGPIMLRRSVSESTNIRALAFEVLGLVQSILWSGDIGFAQVMVNRPVRTAAGEQLTVVDSARILEQEVGTHTGEGRRLTHASVAYGQEEGDDEAAGFALAVNNTAYDPTFYGAEERNRREHALKSGRWLLEWDAETAALVVTRWAVLGVAARPKLGATQEWRDELIGLGTFADVTTIDIQDAHGAPRTMRCRAVQRKRGSTTFRFVYEETGWGRQLNTPADPEYAWIGPVSLGAYDSETAENKAKFCFLAKDDGTLGAASDPGKVLS